MRPREISVSVRKGAIIGWAAVLGLLCRSAHAADVENVIFPADGGVVDAAFRATVGEFNFTGKPHPIIIQETQAGTPKELLRERALRRGGASTLPLFVAQP